MKYLFFKKEDDKPVELELEPEDVNKTIDDNNFYHGYCEILDKAN